MKDTKLEMTTEREIQPGKKGPNLPELAGKSDAELKNKRRKEKRREEKIKIIKGEKPQIEEDINKNGFFDDKNISGKDSNYEGKKGKIKKYNKRYCINNKSKTFLIITMIFFNLIIPNNNMIEYNDSYITLKIQGPGFSNILSSDFLNSNYPNNIYINGIQNSTITNRYYFNEINNTVKLVWSNPINYCKNMFLGCFNITEIDLSNFDASNVEIMWSMFDGCSRLSSLNLLNFNTSKVRDMCAMFSGCSQLSSLNLSNFQTSNVLDMRSMFSGCSQLSSLDLSNFNTLKVQYMNNMFSGCSKLEYFNLNNFIENNSLTVTNIFNNVPDNIVLCLNGNSAQILGQITDKNSYTLDCSDDWKIYQKNIANKTDICFDNFNIGIVYRCEYHGLYYEYCKNENLINNSPIK